MRIAACLCVALSIVALGSLVRAEDEKPEPLKVVWEVKEGLSNPESAYLDAKSGHLFVSNVAGGPAEKNGEGYISKLSPKGEMLEAKWFTGLNAPKGLRSHNGVLWVSDIDELVAISIETGKEVQRVKIEGAQFLNDVAVDDAGAVYVSDMPASRILKVVDGKATVFAEGEELESPNGLLVDGDRLLIAAWGYAADFNPKTPGRLLSLDMKTKKVTPITKSPTGNLDGIELDGKGGYIVTDWKAGKVFHISAEGKTRLIAQHEQGAADHAYLPEKKLFILPHMMENRVTAYEF
jgi:DNA-binding beta-propeller fold protein YncE